MLKQRVYLMVYLIQFQCTQYKKFVFLCIKIV
jgi:hypothetical protein